MLDKNIRHGINTCEISSNSQISQKLGPCTKNLLYGITYMIPCLNDAHYRSPYQHHQQSFCDAWPPGVMNPSAMMS